MDGLGLRNGRVPAGTASVTLWHLKSLAIDELVAAPDQWRAWDTLRERRAEDFGLVVSAEPNEDEQEMIPVQTAMLMRRWRRDDDAERFDAIARAQGLI